MITAMDQLYLVLCEYSKFRMESNSYFSIRFDSKRAQLCVIHKGVQENDVSVKMCMCTVLLLTMVKVLYLLEVGPLWPTYNRNHNIVVP